MQKAYTISNPEEWGEYQGSFGIYSHSRDGMGLVMGEGITSKVKIYAAEDLVTYKYLNGATYGRITITEDEAISYYNMWVKRLKNHIDTWIMRTEFTGYNIGTKLKAIMSLDLL